MVIKIFAALSLFFAGIALFEGVSAKFLAREAASLRLEIKRLERENAANQSVLELQNAKIESYAQERAAAENNAAKERAAAEKRAAGEREKAEKALKKDSSCENRLKLIEESLEVFYAKR
jgi:biopolymer transport protein ExbB/TolQ